MSDDSKPAVKEILEYHDNGSLRARYFSVNGKSHGDCSMWYSGENLNGEIKQGPLRSKTTYKHDQRHGEFKAWYITGEILTETTYYMGRLNGSWNTHHRNGQMWIEDNYVNGRRHGHYRIWTEDGELVVHDIYEDGQQCFSVDCVNGVPVNDDVDAIFSQYKK